MFGEDIKIETVCLEICSSQISFELIIYEVTIRPREKN